MKEKIVVIDDEKAVRDSVSGIFADEGFDVITAGDGPSGIRAVRENIPDAVMLDIWMPGTDGMEVLRVLREEVPLVPVVMMSGHGTIETAVTATRLGAFDFIEKPLTVERLLLVAKNAIGYRRLLSENARLKEQLSHKPEMAFKDPVTLRVLDALLTLSREDRHVIITGERATGKTSLARLCHEQGLRKGAAMVEIDCTRPHDLDPARFASQLEAAVDGTFMIKEFTHLPEHLQLLAARQAGRTRMVLTTSEEFRTDQMHASFYHALGAITVHLPPLRERKQDIAEILCYFSTVQSMGHAGPQRFTSQAMEVLENYHWPGNIREIRSFVEQMRLTVDSDVITHYDLPDNIVRNCEIYQLEQKLFHHNLLLAAKRAFEREFIRQKLIEAAGNRKRAAEIMGISERHLSRKIAAYQLDDHAGQAP